MREGAGIEIVNAVDEFEDRKQRTTILGRQENTRPGGDMGRSGDEHATQSSQPCRKGSIRGKMSALEAAYGGCRVIVHLAVLEPRRVKTRLRKNLRKKVSRSLAIRSSTGRSQYLIRNGGRL